MDFMEEEKGKSDREGLDTPIKKISQREIFQEIAGIAF